MSLFFYFNRCSVVFSLCFFYVCGSSTTGRKCTCLLLVVFFFLLIFFCLPKVVDVKILYYDTMRKKGENGKTHRAIEREEKRNKHSFWSLAPTKNNVHARRANVDNTLLFSDLWLSVFPRASHRVQTEKHAGIKPYSFFSWGWIFQREWKLGYIQSAVFASPIFFCNIPTPSAHPLKSSVCARVFKLREQSKLS